jgi:hypothetical protein
VPILGVINVLHYLAFTCFKLSGASYACWWGSWWRCWLDASTLACTLRGEMPAAACHFNALKRWKRAGIGGWCWCTCCLAGTKTAEFPCRLVRSLACPPPVQSKLTQQPGLALHSVIVHCVQSASLVMKGLQQVLQTSQP